jgi:hypothetical protein
MISIYKTTRHQNPEVNNPYNRRCVNVRTYVNKNGDSVSWDSNWQETIAKSRLEKNVRNDMTEILVKTRAAV